MIAIERLSKSFETARRTTHLALADISLSVAEGEFVSILGPSGCGKSTLLNAIAGLEKLDRGEIEFRASQESAREPRLGYVFQDPRLLNWKRVEGNLTFALRGMKVPRREWGQRLDKYLDLVGLSEFRRQYPLYLSGGMRQRIGLARALAVEPELLLMDEPFSKLDQLTSRKLRQDAVEICARLKQTALLVTHDVEEAAYMGDRIVIFSARPARIVEVVDNPLALSERDFDDLNFIQFKKKLLNTVLRLVDQEGT